MEIHIDTKRDSDEEISKTIRFLQSLIGEEPFSSERTADAQNFTMFDDTSSQPSPMNMFGSDDDAPSDYSPDDTQETEEESIIEIVEY